MSERESLWTAARRKLVEGTEVLRTGGGAELKAGECHAVLDRFADLERLGDLLAKRLRMHMALDDALTDDDRCVVCKGTLAEWEALRGT